MKLIKNATAFATILCTMLLATGCGKKSDSNTPGGIGGPGGVPGYGIAQPLPNGGVAIYFSGSNNYFNASNPSMITASGGTVNPRIVNGYPSVGSYGQPKYCMINVCHEFLNNIRENGMGAGATVVGGGGISGQQLNIQSRYYSGSTLQIGVQQTSYTRANVTGVLTLSAQYMQQNFPGGIPALVQIAYDVYNYSGLGTGAIVFYTAPTSGGVLIF